MAVTTQDVQKLYIAYFNRPADYFGLQFQVKAANATSLAAVANSFANSPEFLNEYAGKTDAQFVNSLYINLFGREADLPGLSFWINLLNTGVVTKGSIALDMLKGAINQDATTVANKVIAAEAFYAAIDTTAEATAYSGAAANAVAKAFLAGVTTDASKEAAITTAALNATLAAVVSAGTPAPVVTTFNLTTGVDAFGGTSGNDVFNATDLTFTGLDSIDGGSGNDTLNIFDVTGGLNLAVATVRNVEKVSVSSTAGLAGNAGSVVGYTGVTAAEFNLKGAAIQTITAAGTTAVTVANTAGVTVIGGSSAAITAGNTGVVAAASLRDASIAASALVTTADANTDNTAGSVANLAAMKTAFANAAGVSTADKATVAATTTDQGLLDAVALIVSNNTAAATGATAVNAVNASGTALASVTVKGGSTVAVTDTSTAGTSLKSVSLDGNVGTATLTGKALTAVSIANNAVATNIVNAADGGHAIAITVNKLAAGATITDTTATSATLNAVTAASTATLNVAAAETVAINAAIGLTLTALNAAAATDLTVTGAGKVTVSALTATVLENIDASANTGGVVFSTTALGNDVMFTGGAGADSIILAANTHAIVTGAGNDTVTLTSALGTGGSVNAGAGTDILAGTSAAVSVLTALEASKFTGFETLKINNALISATYDVSGFAGVSNFVAAAGVTASQTANVTNIGANGTVTLNGFTTGGGTLNVAMAADTAADVLNLVLSSTFTDNNDATADVAARAVSVTANNVETINVSSTGTTTAPTTPVINYKADGVVNNLSLVADEAVNVNITGNQAIVFTSQVAMVDLATINASDLTAKATIIASASTSALTIKGSATIGSDLTGGTVNDIITGGAKSDVIRGMLGADLLTGNGGNDIFVLTSASDSTLIRMDTITDFVANTYGNAVVATVATGGAGTGAVNADFAMFTGDVIDLRAMTSGVGNPISKLVVSMQNNAADAQVFLQNVGTETTDSIAASLDVTTGKLYLDFNSDGTVDSVITLTGVTSLTAAAFLIA
jgi:hypothetical protein